MLRQGEGEFVLEPEGLLTLGLRATRKRDRIRLDLRISWSEGEKPDSGAALEIRGKS